MTSGETILKITDFPFSYSLLGILFASWGVLQENNLIGFLTLAGALGSFLAITDPVGIGIKWAIGRVFKDTEIQVKENEITVYRKKIKNAVNVKAVKIEIDKYVTYTYFLFLLAALISGTLSSDHLEERFYFETIDTDEIEKSETEKEELKMQRIFEIKVAIVVTSIIGIALILWKILKDWSKLLKYTEICARYQASINSEDVVTSSIEKMGNSLDNGDWEIAKQWSDRLEKESRRKRGRKDEVESLIKNVYKPLYDECILIEQNQRSFNEGFDYTILPNLAWGNIKNIPEYHKIDDPEFISIYEEFHKLIEDYNEKNRRMQKVVSEQIIKTYSQIFGKELEKIEYEVLSDNARNTSDLVRMLMILKHPKEHPYYKNIQGVKLIIRYKTAIETINEGLESQEDLKKFDEGWGNLIRYLNKVQTYKDMVSLFHKIEKLNLDIKSRLYQKFSISQS